jgi:hypothetical protein
LHGGLAAAVTAGGDRQPRSARARPEQVSAQRDLTLRDGADAPMQLTAILLRVPLELLADGADDLQTRSLD